jgi:hypothetical protein
MQVIAFLCSVTSGFACAKWSKPNSDWVWVALAFAIFLAILFFGEVPGRASYPRMAIFLFGQPLGAVFGALIFLRISRGKGALPNET